jgi:hypothetical protein
METKSRASLFAYNRIAMTEESKSGGGTSLVSDATKVADTSVMKDLLGRSAKAAGDYLGEHAEVFFKKLRERRWKNLRDHEQKVAEVTGAPVDFLGAPERGAAIERWVNVAADVPLEDSEKAAILEAVLEQILFSNRSSEFQDVSERLSSSGMRILLNAPSDRKFLPGGDERENAENLRELGLARRLDLARVLSLFAAWCIGTGLGLYGLTRVIPSFLPTTFSVGFVLEGAIVSGVIFALGMALLYTNYTLTEFGRSLQRSALRFYPTKSRLREFRIASLVPGSFLAWTGLAVVLALGSPLLLSSYLPRSETIRTIVLSAPPQTPPAPSATPTQGAPRSPPQPQALKTEDIATLVDVWRSVSEQMNTIIDVTNQVDGLLSAWPKRMGENRADLLDELGKLRDTVNQRRVSVATLANFYARYPNIRAALTERNSEETFSRLYRALDSFFNEVRSLPPKPLENFESTLRPYAGEMRLATTALSKWADETRSYANAQSKELNNAK